MPGTLTWSDTTVETILLSTAVLIVIVLAIIGYRAWKTARITPEERERKRRSVLALRGKLGDAALVDYREDVLVYSYDVRGVEYTASQDVSTLKELVPLELTPVVGIKYLPENPANSIVLAEEWNGLRMRQEHS